MKYDKISCPDLRRSIEIIHDLLQEDIKVIDLSGEYLENIHLRIIGDLICNNAPIEKLNLSDLDIRSGINNRWEFSFLMRMIPERLENHKYLKTLIFGSVDQYVYKEVGHMLDKNETIEKVFFRRKVNKKSRENAFLHIERHKDRIVIT